MTAVGVAWRLVAKHHVSYRYFPSVVVAHGLPDVSLIYDFCAKARPACSDELAETFVVEGFPDTDGVVADTAVERGYHVLPIVVVCRHQDDASVLVVVGLKDFGIFKDVAFPYLPQMSAKIECPFNQEVGHVAVVLPLDFSFLALAHVGERTLQVAANHFESVASHVVNNRPQQVAKSIKNPQWDVGYDE